MRQPPRDLDAEAVVAQKDIADAGDQDARRSCGFDLLDAKEEAVAGLAQHTQIFAGIVIEHDGKMNLALVILLDAFDDADLAGQREIQDVAAGLRAQADAVADA